MAARSASVELLAAPADVWAFLAEPHHLADWWPNVAFVRPDRLGATTGARWTVHTRESTWLRRADTEDTLLVHAAQVEQRFAFELVRAKLRADLTLTEVAPGRTRADLTVSGSLLRGFTRSLPRDALARLYELVQTAADV
ncbi:MAG TPA: SRPBCC family protein [Gaiellaceae bacterium]|nr:SRPBCC family protein [Gaiellaceae bacterium]